MSTTQPTARERLIEAKHQHFRNIELLNKHSHKWGEAEHYSAARTVKNLSKQIEQIDLALTHIKD